MQAQKADCRCEFKMNEELLKLIGSSNSDPKEIKALAQSCGQLNTVYEVPQPGGSVEDTYLNYAVSCNNVMAVRILLDNGADPSLVGGIAELPLYNAVFLKCDTAEEVEKQLRIACLLLAYGADPDQLIPSEGQSVYEYLCETLILFNNPSSTYECAFYDYLMELFDAKLTGALSKDNLDETLASISLF